MNKPFALPATAALLLLSACAEHQISDVAATRAPSDVALAANSSNSNSGFGIHPNGFGQKSFAAWRAHEGLPDANGKTNMALYFQKMTTTPKGQGSKGNRSRRSWACRGSIASTVGAEPAHRDGTSSSPTRREIAA